MIRQKRHTAALLLFVTGLFLWTGCDKKDDNYSSNNSNYNVVKYEVEDLNGNEIWADELIYKDETGIKQEQFNYHVSNQFWNYEAQFEKGKSYYLYYEEYVEPNESVQDYRLSVHIDGQLVDDEFLNIQPGQVNSAKIEGVVQNP